jgi:hypothetical protein
MQSNPIELKIRSIGDLENQKLAKNTTVIPIPSNIDRALYWFTYPPLKTKLKLD